MLSRRMKLLIFFVFAFLFIAGGAWYFLTIKPLEIEIATLQESIKTEKRLIYQYENGNPEQTEQEIETLSLQKRVPVVDNMEQFLLMLEEAEVVSKSLIQNVSFSKSTEAVVNETTVEEDINNLEAGTYGMEQPESDEPILPEGLEKLVANLTIEADDYFELKDFVQRIEQFDRIINVDSLQYNGFTEITNITEEISEPPVLSYNMAISTYYFPKLEELKDQAPKYESENPSEKKNPLYQSELENLGFILPEKPSTDSGVEALTYTVKPGDTLFGLALKFYNSNDGMEKIREANGLMGSLILTGQELLIPL